MKNIIKYNENTNIKQKCSPFLLKIFIILILSLITFSLEKEYLFCLRCIKNNNIKNLDFKCNKCPNELVFRDFHFASTQETLNEILIHNKSISRFGDGEIN